MAETTFQPATAPGQLTRDYNAGFDRSRSMMERATQFRQQTQLRDQQIEANKVLAPLHEAQAKAQIVGAGAAIQNNTRLENLRTQAALASKPANDEYLDATQLADWNQQEIALGALQAKYSWMGNIPEYKGFLDTIDKARSNALKRSLMDQQIEEAHFRAETAADARATAAETAAASRLDVAQVQAGSRETVAETAAGSRTGVAQINADSRETIAATSAKGKLEAATLRAKREYEIDTTIEKRDEAVRDGDTERAQIYQDHLNKLNATSSGSPERTLPATVRPAPAQKATAAAAPAPLTVPGVTAPPKAPIVSIEGKDYPIFKDKNGKRAYLKDGHYIEIAPEDTPAQ